MRTFPLRLQGKNGSRFAEGGYLLNCGQPAIATCQRGLAWLGPSLSAEARRQLIVYALRSGGASP